MRMMGVTTRVTVALVLAGGPLAGAHLNPAAKRAFREYAAVVEARRGNSESLVDAGAERQLRSGIVRVDPVDGGNREVSGGLLHDWQGSAFVPGAKRKDMLALLRNYDQLAIDYAPEVEWSHVLAEQGGTTRLALRLRKQKVVTVVLDAEYDVSVGLIGSTGGFGLSRSTHIWQIDEPGTPREHRRAEGDDDGFLWRLNAYWSFVRTSDGLLIQCEAVSLTRDVPAGLGWLILPIVRELPRTSLEFTLTATRNALLGYVEREKH